MQARDIGKHLSAKSIGEDGRKKLLNILFFEAMGQLEYTGLKVGLMVMADGGNFFKS
jgi:hypothetical protein